MKRIRRIIRALDPKADATMGQRERLEAFRIRRAAVLVLVLFLLIASMTSCSVHALLVRMTPKPISIRRPKKPNRKPNNRRKSRPSPKR